MVLATSVAQKSCRRRLVHGTNFRENSLFWGFFVVKNCVIHFYEIWRVVKFWGVFISWRTVTVPISVAIRHTYPPKIDTQNRHFSKSLDLYIVGAGKQILKTSGREWYDEINRFDVINQDSSILLKNSSVYVNIRKNLILSSYSMYLMTRHTWLQLI